MRDNGLRAVSRPPSSAPADLPTVGDKTKGLVRREGLLPSFVNAEGGAVYLEVRPDAEGNAGRFLYREALRTGIGSNDLGWTGARWAQSTWCASSHATTGC